MANAVAMLISPEEVPSLRLLLLGGEVLTPEVRNAWTDSVTLMNGYVTRYYFLDRNKDLSMIDMVPPRLVHTWP